MFTSFYYYYYVFNQRKITNTRTKRFTRNLFFILELEKLLDIFITSWHSKHLPLSTLFFSHCLVKKNRSKLRILLGLMIMLAERARQCFGLAAQTVCTASVQFVLDMAQTN